MASLQSTTVNGILTVNLSSGTMISSSAMTDMIGWNASYGAYIGSTVGSTTYLYGNGSFYDGTANRTLLHSSNVGTYAFPRSGSWAADLVTSYGFTREHGMQMTGGSEFVVLSKSGQGYLLVDGSYYAAEGGGFYSTNNSSGGTLLGFYADTTTSLNFNTATVKLNSNQILHAGNYGGYSTFSGSVTAGNDVTWSGYNSGNARSVRIGYSGGNYGAIGYGINFTTTTNTHTYAINDNVTRVDLYDGIVVYGAAGGTVGTNVSWTTLLNASRGNTFMQWKGNNVLDASNYNSYAPTLTGTGASGNWAINVTGSAGSVAWSGITSKPTTLDGFGITGGTTTGMISSYTNLTNTDDWTNSPISLRERGLVGNAQSSDIYAPNLNFHWGNYVSNSLWMNTSGHLSWGSYSGTGVPASDGVFKTGNLLISNAIGIGTTNAVYSLHVIGSGAITGQFTVGYGSFAAPGLTVGDNQYGLYASAGNLYYKSASSGVHYWRNIANSANPMTLDNNGNLTITGALSEGGYTAYPDRIYTINLSAQSTANFYPVVLDEPPGEVVWHHRFSIEMASQGGASSFNNHTLVAEVRGQGWSDQQLFYRAFHTYYDSAERSILGIWRGTQSWYGVVVYLRGGQTYYVRTNSRSVTGYTSAVTLNSNATFAIKNSSGTDVSGTSANIQFLLNLITNPSGFYYSDIVVAPNIYAGRFYDNDNSSYYLDPASTSILNTVTTGAITSTVIKGDSGADYPHSFTNTDSGNTHWTNRNNRLLTSNGTNWATDGRDPIMALVTSGNSAATTIANSIGLALHNESQTNNTFSPAITFSNRSNSGSYNTTYAAIIGRKTGQGSDSNWSAGELHFYTMPVGGYINDTPSLIINSAGRIGIGITSPAYKLDVNGTTRLGGIVYDEAVQTDDFNYFNLQPYIESETLSTILNLGGTAPSFITLTDTTSPFSKVMSVSAYGDAALGDYIPVQAGETIYGEVWAYRATGAAGTAGALYCGVMRYDKDKKMIDANSGLNTSPSGYFIASNVTVPSNSTWTKYSGTLTLPTSHTSYSTSDGGPVRYIRPYIIYNYIAGTIPTYIGGWKIRKVELTRDSGVVAINGNIIFPNTSNSGLSTTDGTALLRLDDTYGNIYLLNNAGGFYVDATTHNFRNASSSNLMVINSSGDVTATRYLVGTYVNTTDNVPTSENITYVMAKFGDSYHRSASAAKVAGFISGQSMNINGSSTSCTGNAATATTSSQLGGVAAANYVRNDVDGTDSIDLFRLKTFTKSLTITTSWLDTGISGTDLATGVYAISLYVDNYSVGGGHYAETYAGIISWYSGGTNSNDYDEITLHKSGHAPNTRYINLRTLRQGTPNPLKLQIISSVNTSGASNYIFKFRRMI